MNLSVLSGAFRLPSCFLPMTNELLILLMSLLAGLGLWLLYHEGLLRTPRIWMLSALLLLLVFYQNMPWDWLKLEPGLHSANYESLSFFGKTIDNFKHMLLPTLCYSYGSLAYLSRFIKSNMEEVVRQDYIRTARAKGVSPRNVTLHHAFRNTLIPFVTLLGMSLPGLVGGSVILENIFRWPGIGQLFLDAITWRDHFLIMGLVLMFSTLTLLGQLLADMLYSVVDPRVIVK